jgi:Polysaccharide pyruvyl transferase
MSLRVHHYCPKGTGNIGDDLVVLALQQTLERRLGPCSFTTFAASERGHAAGESRGLCQENIERSNAEADLVLVGGSNLLEPRKGRQRDDCNIPLLLDDRAIARLRRPLLLAGMGTGSSFGKWIRAYTPRAVHNLRTLFNAAFAHAVRDVTTVDRLAKVGIPTNCTGCPVTFLTARPVQSHDARLPLLVSFPPGRILDRFLGPAFMALALKYLDWLQAERVPFVVTLHEATDQAPARRLLPSNVEIFYTENLPELISRFEQCRGVVGFRLHAALLGMGLGKPIIPVGVDWRGLGFIKTIGADDISIRPFRFGQLQKLQRLTARLLENDPLLLARLRLAKQSLYACHDEFFRQATLTFTPLAQAG